VVSSNRGKTRPPVGVDCARRGLSLNMKKTSELPGFYKLDMVTRRRVAAEHCGLSCSELDVLAAGAGLADSQADHMVENAVGVMGLPLGLCVNMLVDGKDHIVPMAVEEPSVVAACSYAAKLLRQGGGVRSMVSAPHMIGQIQLLDVPDPARAETAVLAAKAELVSAANAGHHGLVSAGGGVVDVEVRHLPAEPESDSLGPMMVVHLIVDVRDAMGANAINTMCEKLAPRIAELSGGRVGLRILSNLSDRRTVEVVGRVPVVALDGKGASGGRELAKAIEEASVFAERDPYRAATHNKGIMNGVDAVLIALGQDWRAIEAGAHAFAARRGRYTALARWRLEGDFLVGRMTLPMAVGTVGGIVNVHPTVKLNRKIANLASTSELASVVTAAGLAQNLSAIRALSAEGIQSGHMRLHARNVAIQAGAVDGDVARVATLIADRKTVNLDAARAALVELRSASSESDAPPEPSEPPKAATPSTPSTPRCGPSLASDEDKRFCETILPAVSRTFALSIQALPPELKDAIGVAYLLCRVVDTVEDDRRLPPAIRGPLFDAFDAALERAAEGDASLSATFERLSSEAGLGPKPYERELCDHAGASFRTFASLLPAQRAAIYPSVREMSKGMRSYSERADAEGGLRLRNTADLEKYCYFVAGTVGELLTALFSLAFPVTDAVKKELEARAVSFGLGLQLVNILKDVAEDAERGDCFLPKEEADALGLSLSELLAPTERAKGLALLRQLSMRARFHLDRAEEYTLAWPRAAAPVRLFCAVPLALALATLREVELGDDALRVGRAPTVSRALVMRVFEDALTASAAVEEGEADALLRTLFDRARTGVITRAPRPSTEPHPTSASAPEPAGPSISSPSPSVPPQGAPMNSPFASKTMGLQPRRTFGGKILVTGAAGHVGANMVYRLLAEDRDVRVLLRDGSNNDAIDAIERATGKKVERMVGDLRDGHAALAAARGCEAVFHVAARVSTTNASERELLDIYQCNVIGTANLLRAAGETGVKRTVVTGSLSAVGLDPEDPSRPCDETMPFYPFAEHLPYGRTKSLVEHETLKAVVEGVDAVIATSCAVLGPWDYKPSRMGRTLIDFSHGKLRAYLPGGFDFVNVKDLVEGHVLALERGRSGQRYILSTEFATVDSLMDVFEEVSGRPRPKLKLPATLMAGVAEVTSLFMSTFFPETPQRFTPAAVRLLRMERKADTSKAQAELGYRPTSVRSAIHEAYAQFAERGLVPEGPVRKGQDSIPPAANVPSSKVREGAAA
jgi:degradative hydroxymethylglutaryl-CoA reductase